MEDHLTLTMEQLMSAGESIAVAVDMAVVQLRGGSNSDCAHVCALVGQFFLEQAEQKKATAH